MIVTIFELTIKNVKILVILKKTNFENGNF